MLDLTHITETMFPEHLNNPGDINLGNCFNWAYGAYLIYRDSHTTSLWTDFNQTHGFIKIEGLFYDSEAVRGVSKPEHLNTYIRCGVKPVMETSANEFYVYWANNGLYSFWKHNKFVEVLGLKTVTNV